ncbi:hypothetical protein RI129_008336 [Pyrocoelia pectoralis]|uniref:Sodium-dependent multivitamin transporter n=1 Tax=Pyrocoelia pectoralis TaxID=417401 RepID=A0AAN7VF24_9COLE
MTFELIDYIISYGTIIVSLCIGLYFGIFKKSQTTDEYLLGNRQMKIVPVAISIIASLISGVTVLGNSADVYVFGANFVWACLAGVVANFIGGFVYVPVLIKLNTPNVFEYFELRFDRKIKIMASCIYTLQVLISSSVVAYIPAIAFSQATGVNPHTVSFIVCSLCVFYTTIGGFKAVVWTDVFQFLGIISSVVAVSVIGIIKAGGIDVVLKEASSGHRLDFNFDIDPTKRDGFWQMMIGSTITCLYYTSLQPGTVQKYVSVSQFKNVMRVMVVQCCGSIIITFLSAFIGLVVYARYSDCDPISTGKVPRIDQILPYFVMDIGKHVPGLPGIFIAGIFSAALSTLSSSLNTLAATIYGDLVSSFISRNISQHKEGWILKLIVIMSGSLCAGLTLFLDRMGSLMSFLNAMTGLIIGIFVGLFSLGIIFPVANSKGAFFGTVSSLFSVGTIAVLNHWYTMQGGWKKFAKPVSLKACDVAFNITLPSANLDYEEPFILFRLSFWYNSVISALMVTFVGLLVSWFTRRNNYEVYPDLMFSIYRKNSNEELLKKYAAGVQHDENNTYDFQPVV